METLATLYVMLVTVASSLFPSADLPQVLGVKIAETEDVEVVRTTEAEEEEESDKTSTSSSPTSERVRTTHRLEAKEKFERAHEDAKKRREEAKERVKTSREEFKEKLETLKDERKKQTTQNIDEKLSQMNEKWIDHFNNVLSRLSQILAKVKDKALEASGEGVDVSSINEQVQEAEAAITAASDAVNAQAGKTYVIEITDEENLGENVSEAVHNLRDDLKAVREKVRMAREATHEAVRSLKEVLKPNEENEEES